MMRPETDSGLLRGVSGLVFDMDGVLIDSHPAHRAAWRQFLRLIGKDVSETDLAFILEGRTRAEIIRHFVGDLPGKELERFGQKKDEIFRAMEPEIRPIPGVMEFLESVAARRLRCAVATSASEIRTESTIERLELTRFFGVIVTASDVVRGKPDPEVYRLACAGMNISPEQALAFDDSRAGVLAAIGAGLRCIGVGSDGAANGLREAGAERVIVDFREVASNGHCFSQELRPW